MIIVTHPAYEALSITLCGDEPPIIHDDETLDLEEYISTVVSDEEVAE